MSGHDEERMKQVLRAALPPVEPMPNRERIFGQGCCGEWMKSALRRPGSRWLWFDGALLAGLAILAVAFPASIPLLVYYL